MEKAYKYRIYPNKKQKELLAKTFGCSRFVYNHFLNKRIETYQIEQKTLTYNRCSSELTKLKSELEWLKEPDKCSLQNAIKDMDRAYKNFFKNNAGFPKYKSKKTHRFSYRTNATNGNIAYCEKHIKLPKLGMVKTRTKLVPQGRILNATITQEPSGKYYVSLCCTEVEIPKLKKTGNEIGIDLGIKSFAVTSSGYCIPNPKYLQKSLNKLARLQRELSRKTRGGSNWNKARIKVARLQEHIVNQRADFLQKLSTNLIRENDVICVEDLQVKNMIQNHKLARNIADVSWSEFVRQLEYKADWYGKTLIKVDKWYASSQICNCCGHRFPITKDLSIREWICPNCHTTLDRDANAARNILREGKRILANVA
jgi:putative transposase